MSDKQLEDNTKGAERAFIVKNIAIQPYNVNSQDFQLVRSDEVRFGIDTLAPSTIIFDLSVLNNYALENMESLTGQSISDSLLGSSRSLLSALADEWKAVDTRKSWGAMEPLLFCDKDGVTRQIYGRPGKFTHAVSKRGQQWIDVQAEFRRADTYAYSDVENAVEIVRGDNPFWFTQDGDAPAWFRILFYGPVDTPTMTIGGQQFWVDTTIDSSTVLEISSYPWARRIIDSEGVNHRTKLRGATQYLDELRIFPADKTPIRWTDPNIGLATWSEIESTRWEPNPWFGGPIKMPWDTYTRVSGQKIFWHGDRISGGYLSAHLGKSVIIDDVHSYQTANQFAQVTVCEGDQKFFNDEIPDGKTTVCVLADPTMSSYAGVELEKNNRAIDITLQRKRDHIRLVNQSGTILDYDLGVGGLEGGDTVSIETNNNTKMVNVRHNGSVVLSHNGSSSFNWANTRQGFIVNGGNLIRRDGCRVNNLVAHDISMSIPSTQGKCYFMWRDSYNVV